MAFVHKPVFSPLACVLCVKYDIGQTGLGDIDIVHTLARVRAARRREYTE